MRKQHGEAYDHQYMLQGLRKLNGEEEHYRENEYEEYGDGTRYGEGYDREQYRYHPYKGNKRLDNTSYNRGPSDKNTCWICGAPDHFAYDCPKNETQQNQEWGNWDPIDNLATSHGYKSREEYEQAIAEKAKKETKMTKNEKKACNVL